MKKELFVKTDSHAHISSDELYNDHVSLMKRAEENKVMTIINICTCERTLQRGLELEAKYPGRVFNTAATTPHDVKDQGASFFPIVKKAVEEGKLVAIGETGLDYYYEHSPRNLQIEYLDRYFELAKENSINVVIHCRGDDAFVDLFDRASRQEVAPSCLLHCFTGNNAQRDKALELGWKISISGIVTFKRSFELREVVKKIPLESLLIETDSPYLAPQSKRGEQNEPCNVEEIAQVIADIKDIAIEEVCANCVKNSWDFFQLWRKVETSNKKD